MCRLKHTRYYCPPGLLLLVPLLMGAALWDEAKEKSVADKLSRELAYGQFIWLDAENGRKFPGLFTRAIPEHDGSTVMLLVHGMGGHPDWPEVISPLRQLLADNGWTSLSIQMPVLPPEKPLADYGKSLDESQKRLSSAIGYLKTYGYKKVILIGYGFGAAVAANYLVSVDNHDVYAFAGISMLARKYLVPPIDLYASLERLTLPVLDVYGSDDLKTIINSADERRVAARRNGNGNNYEQVVIWYADHYFTGRDLELYNQISRWLHVILQDKNVQIPH